MTTELLIAAADGSVSIESVLLNLGLPGVVILALGMFAWAVIKDYKARLARIEDDNRRLYQIMSDQMIPALTKANSTIVDAVEVLSDIRRREDKQAALEEARRLLEKESHS